MTRAGDITLPARAGLGFKPQHFPQIAAEHPQVAFWEVHAENYMVPGGPAHRQLTALRGQYPLSIHGVGLSLGAESAPDAAHLERLKVLLRRYQPQAFSEHLAWSGHGGAFLNDLLPVCYDKSTLIRVCEHVDAVQRSLGRQLLLENPATYLEFVASTMTETQFLAEVVERTGCGLLLDVNNAYVSAVNHGRDPRDYIATFPIDAVGEMHLAGFAEDRDDAGARLLIDTHGAAIDEAVWQLYADALERCGQPVPTLIERDNDIPALDVLLQEARRADRTLQALAPGLACA